MGAAVLAYQLGYVDASVDAATCSQIHNDAVYQLLSDHPDMVENWLSSHRGSRSRMRRADFK
jgi:hypothetical protein